MHAYTVTSEWSGGRQGQGTLTAEKSGARIELRVPEEFKGPGGATNPEELLASAVCGCYSITFGIIAENRKLPLESLAVRAVGEVEENGAQLTYKTITLHPHIRLSAEATEEQMKMAEDMAHKADLYCIITNAVRGKVEIRVEPTLEKA